MSLHVHCACGQNISGESEDEVVTAVQDHVRSAHPDLVDEFDRARLLSMAHEAP